MASMNKAFDSIHRRDELVAVKNQLKKSDGFTILELTIVMIVAISYFYGG
jgi:type II secretory pathway pseudopilin PulG